MRNAFGLRRFCWKGNMPEKLERKLKLEAIKKGFKPEGKRFGSYVYGSLRKTGWKPSREK